MDVFVTNMRRHAFRWALGFETITIWGSGSRIYVITMWRTDARIPLLKQPFQFIIQHPGARLPQDIRPFRLPVPCDGFLRTRTAFRRAIWLAGQILKLRDPRVCGAV